MKKRDVTVLALVVLGGLTISRCSLFGFGRIEFVGSLADAPASAAVSGARSLSSAATTIAALPLVGAEPQPEVVAETDESGGFAFAVNPSDDSQYAFLNYDPDLGVGVEQFLGFIELPAGESESSTAWPLGNADGGSVVSLGSMTAADGEFLPTTDSNEIYETLNTDQQALILQATRDNFVKSVKNSYLNDRESLPFGINFIHTIVFEPLINAWPDESTVGTVPASTESRNSIITVQFTEPSLELWEGIRDGTRAFRVEPPEPVGTGDDAPTEILTREHLDFPDPSAFSLTIDMSLHPGDWRVYLDDTKIAVYDWALEIPIDAERRNIYFTPAYFIEADASRRIQSITLRWYLYDPAAGTYERFDLSEDRQLPLVNDFYTVSLTSYGEDRPDGERSNQTVEIAPVPGTPTPVPVELYVPPAPEGSTGLSWIGTYYSIGGALLLINHVLPRGEPIP